MISEQSTGERRTGHGSRQLQRRTEAITKTRKDESTKEESLIGTFALFRVFQFSCFRGEGSGLGFEVLTLESVSQALFMKMRRDESACEGLAGFLRDKSLSPQGFKFT